MPTRETQTCNQIVIKVYYRKAGRSRTGWRGGTRSRGNRQQPAAPAASPAPATCTPATIIYSSISS